MLPFEQIQLTDNEFIREFSNKTEQFELMWHMDPEDRIISAITESDWKIQLDNQLPVKITKEPFYIPKDSYHRLIKGSGNLIIKLTKLNNDNNN